MWVTDSNRPSVVGPWPSGRGKGRGLLALLRGKEGKEGGWSSTRPEARGLGGLLKGTLKEIVKGTLKEHV